MLCPLSSAILLSTRSLLGAGRGLLAVIGLVWLLWVWGGPPVVAQPAVSRNIAGEVIPAEFFGLHFRRDKIAWPAVPFGSLRLWDTDTRWQQMNPGPGRFEWAVLDDYLRAAKSHGVSDVFLTLSSTPRWASSDPSNRLCDYGGLIAPGTRGDCDPPNDLNRDGTGSDQHWRDFVYAMAAHLAGLDPAVYAAVKYFGMWNEFTRKASWTGTSQQLVRMAQDANCILTGRGRITSLGQSCTAANQGEPGVGVLAAARLGTPEAVAGPSSSPALGAYLGTAGAAEAADVVVVHAYAYPDMGPAAAEDLGPRWQSLADAIPNEAKDRPAWSSEGSWGDTARRLPDTDMQMAYVTRYFLLGWSLGYRRMYWYAADSSWGRLIRPNGIEGCRDKRSGMGCPTPAAKAWATVYRWMVGSTMTRRCAVQGQWVWTCELTTPDGEKAMAVWDASQPCAGGKCASSSYAAPAGYTKYETLDGDEYRVRDGHVPIRAKPILLRH